MTPPLLPVGWTLCFEALFYVAAGVVIWRPKLIWLVAVVFLGALATRSTPVLKFIGNPIILEFLAGVALAKLPAWRPAIVGLPAGVAILSIGAVAHWPPTGSVSDFLDGSQAWTRLLTLGVPAFLVVWGALQVQAKPGPFSYLGDASYALYLVHPLALLMMAMAIKLSGQHLAPDLIIVAGLALSVIAGWRVHELFEKPLDRLVKTLWGHTVHADAVA
jgi:exopolysaccharide production protein ExoZ